MKDNKKCFCGDSNCKSQIHKEIKHNSKYFKTLKLYSKVDKTIKNEVKELQLKPLCQKGCSECCHQIFFISEVEFSIIVDYLLEHSKNSIDGIIEKSKEIMSYIEINDPVLYHNLEVDVTGGNAVTLLQAVSVNGNNTIPEGCVFLNKNNECSIYKARPLVCRTHGVSYLNSEGRTVLCGKLELTEKNKNEFVDLTSYKDEVTNLFSFKNGERPIVRRPFPIFYWFYYLNSMNLDFRNFRKTVFYNRYASMSESEMIKNFKETYNLK